MIEIFTSETIIAFIAASVILSFVPGPDNIFVMTQSALKGWRVGFFTTLGLCTGLVGHTFLVAIGVSVIFQTSTVAFNGLKILGGLYLLYLGWLSFSNKEFTIGEESDINTHQSYYITGVIMNLTNPKVALFFLVFLPQFIDVKLGSITSQITLLGGLFILTALCVFTSITFLGSSIEKFLKQSKSITKNINKIAALVYFSLAINLFFV